MATVEVAVLGVAAEAAMAEVPVQEAATVEELVAAVAVDMAEVQVQEVA